MKMWVANTQGTCNSHIDKNNDIKFGLGVGVIKSFYETFTMHSLDNIVSYFTINSVVFK